MAEPSIPRNRAELDKLFQGVKELQAEAGRIAERSIASSTGAITFEEELQQKIARGELSPELRRREREAVSGLFGATAGIRKEFEDIDIRPTELRNILAGRINSYLNQIGDIQNQRKARQSRIDDLIKTGGIQATAEAKKLELELAQKQEEAKIAQRNFELFFKAQETRDKAARKSSPVSLGGVGILETTASFLQGISSLGNFSVSDQTKVEQDLFRLGYGGEVPPDWFRIITEEEEGRTIIPERLIKLWLKDRDEILNKTLESRSGRGITNPFAGEEE